MTSKLVKDPGHDLKLPLKIARAQVYNKLIKKDKKH